MTTTDMDYLARILRLVLGVLYVSHALLTWAIFGFEPGAHHSAPRLLLGHGIVAAELLGGVMLTLGLFARAVAIGLLPFAIGTVLLQLGGGMNLSPTECAYLVLCVAGQLVFISGTPIAEDEEPCEFISASESATSWI